MTDPEGLAPGTDYGMPPVRRERLAWMQDNGEEAEEQPTARNLQEKTLQRYQEQERARIPDLIGKIVSSDYKPAPRKSGHKITGDLGRKGRRGL